jgi:hypothetical protein
MTRTRGSSDRADRADRAGIPGDGTPSCAIRPGHSHTAAPSSAASPG